VPRSGHPQSIVPCDEVRQATPAGAALGQAWQRGRVAWPTHARLAAPGSAPLPAPAAGSCGAGGRHRCGAQQHHACNHRAWVGPVGRKGVRILPPAAAPIPPSVSCVLPCVHHPSQTPSGLPCNLVAGSCCCSRGALGAGRALCWGLYHNNDTAAARRLRAACSRFSIALGTCELSDQGNSRGCG
jgi:hypothetical protein